MGNTLSRLFDNMRELLVDGVHAAGPWALPALGALVVLIALVNRDKIVSPGGLIFVLAALAFSVLVKAVQLGRF